MVHSKVEENKSFELLNHSPLPLEDLTSQELDGNTLCELNRSDLATVFQNNYGDVQLERKNAVKGICTSILYCFQFDRFSIFLHIYEQSEKSFLN